MTQASSKYHYQILDGLRGIAAVLVVMFHLLEAYYSGSGAPHLLNHGYLAVDFFFLLSGFVVAYAYDDRWNRMSVGKFFRRRLVRLQPMVIMGSLIGTALYYLQAGSAYPMVATTPVWKLLIVMVVGATLIPMSREHGDIRGVGETHPLNGPAWSLMYEYVANVLYAFVLRRLPLRALSVLTAVAACILVQVSITNGDVIGGWSLTFAQVHVGLARLMFPFLAGMLLMRSGKRIDVSGAFAWAGALLALCLCMPRIGQHDAPWENGLYEAACIVIVFPIIVAIGAGHGKAIGDPTGDRTAKWLGDLSYPLYITHYPLVYVWKKWIVRTQHFAGSTGVALAWGSAVFCIAIALAYACLKWYDEPVRRWLGPSKSTIGRHPSDRPLTVVAS